VDPTGRNANRFYQEFLSLIELLPLLEGRTPRIRQTVRNRKQDQTRLEAEAVSELVQRYQGGETVSVLAEVFAIHRQTASAILRRNRVPMHRSPMTQAEIKKAIALYLEGQSLLKVGSQLGKSAGTIRRVLLSQGLTTRDSHGRAR
jgi:hypothetical protein